MPESSTHEQRKRTYFLLTQQADHFLRRAKSRLSQKIGHDLYSSDTRYSLLLKIQTPQSSHSQRANFCFLIVRLRPVADSRL